MWFQVLDFPLVFVVSSSRRKWHCNKLKVSYVKFGSEKLGFMLKDFLPAEFRRKRCRFVYGLRPAVSL